MTFKEETLKGLIAKVKKGGYKPTHLIIPKKRIEDIYSMKGFKIKHKYLNKYYLGSMLGMEVYCEPTLKRDKCYLIDKKFLEKCLISNMYAIEKEYRNIIRIIWVGGMKSAFEIWNNIPQDDKDNLAHREEWLHKNEVKEAIDEISEDIGDSIVEYVYEKLGFDKND